MNRVSLVLAAVGAAIWASGCGGSGTGPAVRPQEPSPPIEDPEPPPQDPQPPAPPLPDDPLLSFTTVASGLTAPKVVTHAGDGSGSLFVAEQTGVVRILRDGATAVSRFHVLPADPDRSDPASEEVLLTVPQPFANHNGGQLAFGPDGFLYVGLGDGGSGGDPEGNGQNPGTLLGKVLRIDVESGDVPYGIPADNPFASGQEALPEIWAGGLRNPWRFSFDRATGDLYLGDVGQNRWEEVHFHEAGSPGGANYGWNILEGNACFDPPTGCVPPPGYSPPVHVYGHQPECSVTGGYVYRGPGNPAMTGGYLYGDYCSGRIWILHRTGEGWRNELAAATTYRISTFGEDEEGRLYVADHTGGAVHRIDSP
ncbi:MAG: PQQ-dependent sugar dehydrogenase [Deferrisomatales bacterium]|nr:PQQ-dependent sugar dehydrogenase [Deferrisomatales bacterium]